MEQKMSSSLPLSMNRPPLGFPMLITDTTHCAESPRRRCDRVDRGILLLGSCLLSQAWVGALGSPLVLVSSPLNRGPLIKFGVSSKNPLGEEV